MSDELTKQPAEVSDAVVDLVGNELARKHAVYLTRESVRDLLARTIIALRPQSESEARRAAQEQLYTERERHTAEVKRLQAEIGRLQSLRPQAVPMTDAQAAKIMSDLNDRYTKGTRCWGWIDVIREVERFHRIGITAKGTQGEQKNNS